MSRARCIKASGRLLFQTSIDGDTADDATNRLARAGQAAVQLDGDELEQLRAAHPSDCDRCGRPFFDDRHLLTLTGHYVSGSDWEICLSCTSDFLAWLDDGRQARRDAPHSSSAPRTADQ